MKLHELIPDAEALIALEPDELGLRMLPTLMRPCFREQLMLTTALIEIVGHPDPHPNSTLGHSHYPRQQREAIEEAVGEAWAWLIGAALLVPDPRYSHSVMKLSRRAVKLAEEPDSLRAFSARRIPKDSLHAAIREDVWALYHRGKYDTAVFEAMKAVEVAVREAAGLSDRDLGVALMRKAFDKTTGPLADMSMDEGEREMRAHLFAGAIGSYKNPHSHRNVALGDPDEAAEIVMLANHLLRIVSARQTARAGVPALQAVRA